MADLQGGDYSSPRWSWEVLDCAMPMTFDTYDNCAFQCVYCFSFFQRAVGLGKDDYLHHKVRSVNVQRVKDIFTGKRKSPFAAYIANRFVLQWGGLSDGFDWYERKFGKSLELLRFFREIDYPISISTKSTWLNDPSDPASAPYIEAFRGAGNVHVKTSIITIDWGKGARVEQGTRSSEERFKMLERMNALGVGATTVRFRPFILGISADYPFSANSARQIDAMMKRTKEAGALSLTTEFLCLESRAANTAKERFNRIGEAAGFGARDALFRFYKANSQTGAGLLRLNYDLKRPYMEAMQEAAHRHGLKFYVSDAHHKEKSDAAGCCGLPQDGPLSQYNKGQFAEAILIAKRRGSVHWGDIAHMAAWLKSAPLDGEGDGFNIGSTDRRATHRYLSLYDYMQLQWNDPKSINSPARYFGGALVPAPHRDEEGNIVYLYNEPFVLKGERIGSAQELQIALNERGNDMRADGEDWGYVAVPLFVDARDWEPGQPLPLLPILHRWRLSFTLLTTSERAEALKAIAGEADVLIAFPGFEALKSELGLGGFASAWVLDYRIERFRSSEPGRAEWAECSARAWLSAHEATASDPSVTFSKEWDTLGSRALLLTALRPQEEP